MPAVKGQKIEPKYDGEKLYGLIKEGKGMSEIMATVGEMLSLSVINVCRQAVEQSATI